MNLLVTRRILAQTILLALLWAASNLVIYWAVNGGIVLFNLGLELYPSFGLFLCPC